MISKVHDILVKQSLQIFENQYKKESNLYKNNKEQIINGAVEPDYDEHYSCSHYYIYKDSETYYKNRLNKYMRSAKTNFLLHYYMAINLYFNSKFELAFNHLGRAIHYITDIGTPPHTANVSDAKIGKCLFLKPHIKFELYVSNHVNDYLLNSTDNYDYMLNNSFETILNELSKESSQYKKDLLTRTNYEEITKHVVPLIQNKITGLLLKFYSDINNNPFFIESDKIYKISNSLKKISLVEDHYKIEGLPDLYYIFKDHSDKFIISIKSKKHKLILSSNFTIKEFNPFNDDSYHRIELGGNK